MYNMLPKAGDNWIYMSGEKKTKYTREVYFTLSEGLLITQASGHVLQVITVQEH